MKSMGNSVHVARIEDIAACERNALVGGPFGSNLVSRDYVDFGVPVIRGQNLGLGRWVTGDFAYVSDQKALELSANWARPGDIVFTQRGTLGQVAVVPEEPFDRYVISQSQMKLTVDPSKADPLFVYYAFTTNQMQKYVLNHSITTGVPHTNLGILRQTPIPLPPLPEQCAIAHILSTLDDKIELNRQMNQTLEQIAATLFKSWFVDFDPVRAKAEGRQPEGMDAETAALFPDRLVESEIGEIPEGWAVSTVGNEFQTTMGQSPPSDTYNETGEGLPFYQGRVDFGFRFPRRRVYCTAPTRLAAEGDALLSVRAPVGSLNVAIERCAIGRGVAALRHKSGRSSYTYYSLMAMGSQFEPFNGEGTVFGSISRVNLFRLSTLAPTSDVTFAFERFAAPLDSRIRFNELQSRTLSELRDTLLPRLLSGEIRVPLDVLNEEEPPMPAPREEALVQSRF
jgi:type I restriction enzyme S subunit